MSFDFRFEPPTINDFDDIIDYDCDHECNTCCFDCEGADEEC